MLWGVASQSFANSATPRNTVLVMGDSLSAAFGMAERAGWVSLLEKRLADSGHSLQVVNASISGETTRGGRGRIGDLLAKHRPALVLIELGANDGLRGFPIKEMRANLNHMVQASQAQGSKVVLIGVHLPANYGPAYTEVFSATYPMIAEQYDIPLVPFLLEGVVHKPELMLDDQIHPNEQAQPIILDTVWSHLEPLLDQLP